MTLCNLGNAMLHFVAAGRKEGGAGKRKRREGKKKEGGKGRKGEIERVREEWREKEGVGEKRKNEGEREEGRRVRERST